MLAPQQLTSPPPAYKGWRTSTFGALPAPPVSSASPGPPIPPGAPEEASGHNIPRTLYFLGWVFPPLWLAGVALACFYAIRNVREYEGDIVQELQVMGDARHENSARAAIYWGWQCLAALFAVVLAVIFSSGISFLQT